jgi:hypothetical protein
MREPAMWNRYNCGNNANIKVNREGGSIANKCRLQKEITLKAIIRKARIIKNVERN